MWKVNKIGIEQIWYSSDVIDKIKSVCREHKCDDATCKSDSECECLPKKILGIIEKEEN